ncbi:hypothetical protein P389DRAFT_164619 [Cystobasidium minutum MCA 4210]|uniref:uncharacterized protein n=1 Tax=Cystobasidium minutum MCA 4210 TaxID=1397322 RepID=UPI0034CF35B2|eukprot:jgi/Rhomi1/164619/fgenesh1_kg.1_\
MLPAGSWKVDDITASTATAPHRSDSHARQQAPSPPRAIFVRLSDELLQKLKAGQAANAPFQLELASPASGMIKADSGAAAVAQASTSKPVAITLGDISYPLIPPTSVNNSHSSQNEVTDLLLSSSSKLKASSSTSSLKLAAKNSQERYDVGPSTTISGGSRHINSSSSSQAASAAPSTKEKTAENMGERIRERAAQMAKEKESRKIVLMDDDAFPGVKGKKGKSAAGKGQANLMRAGAITAKRSASPANLPVRQGQSNASSSTASRPPNRLIASEAAKGLMKKHNLLPPPHTGSASEMQAASPGSDTSSSQADTVVTSSMPVASAATASAQTTPVLAPSPLPADTKSGNKTSAAPLPASPARRQFHQMKVDTDDLASASSDSEDEDDAPLAVRTQSPIKSHFSPESIKQPVVRVASVQAQAAHPARSTTSSASTVKQMPKARLASESASSASEGSISDKEQTKPPVPPASIPSIVKRLSPESTPSSRASSPGRAATGGPKTVAKTSGGSRLSRPVRKVSPRTSPNVSPAPVLSGPTALAVSESSSATSAALSASSSSSTGRGASPSFLRPDAAEMQLDKPVDEDNKQIHGRLSAEQSPRQTSPGPSPHPSPSSHPLPAKPPQSPSYGNTRVNARPSPSKTSPPPAATQRLDQDKLPQSTRPVTLSLGLPANPITGVMPNIPKSPSSLHPPSHAYIHAVTTVPSAYSTPGASPIISHFPPPNRGSRSPNTGPLKTTTSGKRKGAPETEELSASKKTKNLNGDAVSSLSASTGSEEDGEAEEEEGEYKLVPADAISEAKASPRHGAEELPLQQSEAAKAAPPKPVLNKSGLPSFTKKGRMSELKGRDRSSTPSQAGSQAVSRANTPISYGSLDSEKASSQLNSSPSGYKARVTGVLRISDDAEFAKRSTEFQDKLYPEYTKLYSKLEDMKERFLKGDRVGHTMKSSTTPQQIARMVDEVNERSKDLERIKDGLWQYNDERKRRNGMTRVK